MADYKFNRHKDGSNWWDGEPKNVNSDSTISHKAKKEKVAKKMSRNDAFKNQQEKISKERKEFANKHKGTFMGRPKHELERESGRYK